MSESLYQLWAVPGLKPGNHVHIQGPWDNYGRIVSCLNKPFKTDQPRPSHYMLVFSKDGIRKPDPETAVLYLIRGLGREKNSKPVDTIYKTMALA